MTSNTPPRLAMCPSESLRKLSQLHAYLCADTNTRSFELEDVRASDLSGYLLPPNGQVGEIDNVKLVPFLVTAINNLHERLVAVEKAASQKDPSPSSL